MRYMVSTAPDDPMVLARHLADAANEGARVVSVMGTPERKVKYFDGRYVASDEAGQPIVLKSGNTIVSEFP